MSMTLEQAKEKLAKYGQEHVLVSTRRIWRKKE